MWEEYKYIDVKHRGSRKWERVLCADLEGWINANPEQEDLFCTIQTFAGAVSRDDEPHLAPFFVDFDADTLEQALSEARMLVDYFLVGHEVEPQVWFSGNRGFHVTVEAMVFSAEPSPDLTYTWRHLAERLVGQLGLATLDRRVYSRRRMWRISGTKHSKSGLYKIPLELGFFRTATVEAIRAKAVEPSVVAERDVQAESSSGLSSIFFDCAREYQDRQKVIESKPVEYFFPAARRRVCNFSWRMGLRS